MDFNAGHQVLLLFIHDTPEPDCGISLKARRNPEKHLGVVEWLGATFYVPPTGGRIIITSPPYDNVVMAPVIIQVVCQLPDITN